MSAPIDRRAGSGPEQPVRPPAAGTARMSEWLKLRQDPIALIESLRSVGDVIFFQRGGRPAYVLLHPDHMKDVLVTSHRKFRLTDSWQETSRLLGQGLLHSEGEFHKRQRRLVNPAFHHARIARYAETMAAYSDRWSGRWEHGQEIDAQREMNELTLAIVGKTLFDTDIEGPEAALFRESLNAAVHAFRLGTPIQSMLRDLPLASARRFQEARAGLDSIIYRMIEERRRSGEDRGDLLSMLLLAQDEEGDGGRMTDEQLRDEALTLAVAGHETTANALTWTWYLLSQSPRAEAKLHAELDRALGGRSPAVEDLPALAYTRKVLNESLRLYPPAYVLMRKAVEEHRVAGYTIPVGANVLLFPYLVHRDPRWWRDPDGFDPDRWTSETESARHKFAYVPFGAGPRMCIGENFAWMEATVVVAVLAQRWRLRLRQGHRVVPEPKVNLRPRGGVPMRVELRS